MKKSASGLLPEETFWTILERSNKGHNLADELEKLSEDEIFGFEYWWGKFAHQSYNQALWAVAYTVLGGCGDDGFDYFRFWLITRGKKVYFDALKNADTLCDEFGKLTGDEYPSWEEVSYVPKHVFEEKFGKDFYEAEEGYDFEIKPLPPIAFEWEAEDAESIRKVCPRTFEKWWNNDVF